MVAKKAKQDKQSTIPSPPSTEKKPKGKIKIKKGVVIAIVALVVVLGAGGALIYMAMGGTSASAREYSTATVTSGTLEKTITGSGTLAAGKETEVNSEVSGTVKGLKVSEGDTVKKGDTLFTVNNDDLDTAVTEAAAEVTQAKAQLTSANAQLSSANSLKVVSSSSSSSDSAGGAGGTGSATSSGSTTSGVSKSEKTQQVASAQAQVTQAKSQLSTAQTNYSSAVEARNNKTVKAPVSGTVTTVNVANGGSVSGSSSSGSGSSGGTGDGSSTGSGSSSAAIVISDYTSSMTAAIDVTESELPLIEKGQEAQMTFDSLDDVETTGEVTAISPTGTNTNGVVTFSVTITISDPDSRLRPGMNTSATIVLDKAESVLIVDNAAISNSKTGEDGTVTATVEVLDASTGTTTTKEVTLGLANDTQTAVLSGLSEGDVVVTGTIDTSATEDSSSSSGDMGGGMMMGGSSATMQIPSGGMPTGGPGGGF